MLGHFYIIPSSDYNIRVHLCSHISVQITLILGIISPEEAQSL